MKNERFQAPLKCKERKQKRNPFEIFPLLVTFSRHFKTIYHDLCPTGMTYSLLISFYFSRQIDSESKSASIESVYREGLSTMDRLPAETLAKIVSAAEDGHRLEQLDGIRRRCHSECLQMSPIVHHSNGNDFLKSSMPNGDYHRDGNIAPNGKRNFAHMAIDHSLHQKENIKENISMDESDGIKANDYTDHCRYEKLQLYGDKSASRRQNYLYNLSEEDCDGKDYYDLMSIVAHDFDGQSDIKLMPKSFRDEVSMSMNGHAKIDSICLRRARARSESEHTEFYQVPNHRADSSEVSIKRTIRLRAALCVFQIYKWFCQ